MYQYVLLSSVFIILAKSDIDVNNQFPKCCAKSESLVKLTDSDNIESFVCMQESAIIDQYGVAGHSLLIGANMNVTFGLPQNCQELVTSVIDINNEVELINEDDFQYCYDRLIIEVINGSVSQKAPQFVKLTCGKTSNSKISPSYYVNHFRKCCPNGKSYDRESHSCIDDNLGSLVNSEKWIDSYADKIFLIDYGLNCKSDEYAIEMDEEKFSLEFSNNLLKATLIDGQILSVYSFTVGNMCLDRKLGSDKMIAKGCTKSCERFGALCVRKCCPVGELYKPFSCTTRASTCVPYSNSSMSFNISDFIDDIETDVNVDLDLIAIRSGITCPRGKYVLMRDKPSHAHHLLSSGKMVLTGSIKENTNEYCIEAFDYEDCGKSLSVDTIVCVNEMPKKETMKNFHLSFINLCISCIFLLLTLVTYCLLPELRNLHGLNLICHILSMLLGFSCLARVQYGWVEYHVNCTILGYLIYFGFVSAFFWLNVMCFDIWWTFGNIRSVNPMRRKKSERKRFMWYMLYAWSTSILLTTLMLLLDKFPVNKYLDADIGDGFCWFHSEQNSSSDWPHYIFFVIPMGVIVTINFILWYQTAKHCNKVKSEVNRMSAENEDANITTRFKVERAKFTLTVKLWFVMGAGWICELLSTIFVSPIWLWKTADSINELQGLFIFIVLVMKPKVYHLLKLKLGLQKTRSKDIGLSCATSSTLLSRSVSAEEKSQIKVNKRV